MSVAIESSLKILILKVKKKSTGDMTWVVQLPEGSRPSKHEIQVPEGEVDLFSVTISSLHFAK